MYASEHNDLLQAERGEVLTSEQEGRLAPYRRIQVALPGLGAALRAPIGWEARVLSGVAAPSSTIKTKAKLWVLIPAFAAIALLFALWPSSDIQSIQPEAKSSTLAFEVSVRQSADVVRSAQAKSGDTLVMQAPGYALWVYRDEELILHCPGDASCQSIEGGWGAELTIKRVGTYRVMPVPVKLQRDSTGVHGDDVALVYQAGGKPLWRDIEVR